MTLITNEKGKKTISVLLSKGRSVTIKETEGWDGYYFVLISQFDVKTELFISAEGVDAMMQILLQLRTCSKHFTTFKLSSFSGSIQKRLNKRRLNSEVSNGI